jgi:hypothetical protein
MPGDTAFQGLNLVCQSLISKVRVADANSAASAHNLERCAKRLDRNGRKIADLLYSRSSRSRFYRCFKSGQSVPLTRRGDFYPPVALVSDPAGQLQLLRFLDDVPPKPHTLYSTVDLEMNAFHLRVIA